MILDLLQLRAARVNVNNDGWPFRRAVELPSPTASSALPPAEQSIAPVVEAGAGGKASAR